MPQPATSSSPSSSPSRRSSSSVSRSVPAVRGAVLTYQALVRQVVTPGKLVALGGLGALMVLVGWLVGIEGADPGDPPPASELLHDGATFADGFGLVLLVPIVSLVFGCSVLGEAREDSTLVYLWLRPMGRFPIAVGAAAAAATAALPLAMIPTALGGWLAADRVAGSADLVIGALAASALGTFAYTSLFVLVGLLLRKPIMWGLGYVLLWEGLAVGLGEFAVRLSLRGYIKSLLNRIAELDTGFNAYSSATSLIVLAGVSVACLGLATLRLSSIDVA